MYSIVRPDGDVSKEYICIRIQFCLSIVGCCSNSRCLDLSLSSHLILNSKKKPTIYTGLVKNICLCGNWAKPMTRTFQDWSIPEQRHEQAKRFLRLVM